MASIFTAPARERLAKKCDQMHEKIVDKFYANDDLPALHGDFQLENAIQLIFSNDKSILSLLTAAEQSTTGGSGGIAHFEQVIAQEEDETVEESKQAPSEEKDADAESAMKQKLLEQAKQAAEVAQAVEEENADDLEDFLDDMI